VAYRAYLKAQYPIDVRLKPLHGDHSEFNLTAPFI